VDKLIISNMYRAKNKTTFFAFHQIINRLSDFDIEIHAVWDDPEYTDEWTNKFDTLNCKIVSYTKEQLNEYCLNRGINQTYIDKFPNFKAIYILLIAYYLRRELKYDYYLIYDDDIIIKEDVDELRYCLREQIPCFLVESNNNTGDKSLITDLMKIYPGAYDRFIQQNPQKNGYNAGFMGIRLEIYDDFLENDEFEELLDLFDFNGVIDKEGNEILRAQRTKIDTQQQSFFSFMNQVNTIKPPLMLPYPDYFICPNFGTHPRYGKINPNDGFDGWGINMKSKIIHFIGHSFINGIYYGKPKAFNDLVDEYLKENNLI
tara:strand:- start:208 stop:1158 length:951 start_codon:yes stop_codon:yes gene_type:complete